MSSNAAKRIADESKLADDDEPLDPELQASLDESEEQYRRGDVYPAEQVLAEMRAILYG